MVHRIVLFFATIALAACGGSNDSAEEGAADAEKTSVGEGAEKPAATLEPEPIPNVLSLPRDYPDTWFFAQDLNFFNMVDGKIVILDAAAETRAYKAQLPAGSAASFAYSSSRGEIYVAETIHELRVRGPRHDILFVYDVENLEPLADIELPPKRYQGMPYESSFVLIDEDAFGLIFNFTPAASVTVVDIAKREVVSEIPVPGCAMMFPTGPRGFSTICGNGGMTTIQLDETGNVASEKKTQPFFNIDDDAMYMMNAEHEGVRYFPTYLGHIQPIDFTEAEPKLLERWSLFTDAERAEGRRPGGWQLITNDSKGEFYILVHPDGGEGTHKDPSAEVWVYSMADQRRMRTLQLKHPAISIEATKGEDPYLIALNIDLELDIYDAQTGEWLRKIGGLATETALGLHAVE